MKQCRNIFVVLCVLCMVWLCATVIPIYAQETPSTTVQSPENTPGNETPVQELSPQIQKETSKNEANEPQFVKKESADATKKEEKNPAATAPETTQKTDAPKGLKVDSKSLLSITDGAFRYSRIPGITIEENNEQIIAHIEQEKQNIDTDEKGLFGLSKQASDRMAKIILVVIIFFVFILYRMRTRNTSGSVLRRFPK
ncbi:MAG: hypothetical protein QHH74_08770 [Spirochaetota bacterium]|nr:hypothetical protein [Spirochaetota bacterium]